MLITRVLSAIVILLGIVAIKYFATRFFFGAIVAIVVFTLSWEWIKLIGKNINLVKKILYSSLSATVFSSAYLLYFINETGFEIIAVINTYLYYVVILCLALWGILFYCIKNSKLFLRLHSYYILDVFGLILFPTFGWCLVSLFPNFFTIVLLVASVDSFAYFSGKLFGKTKFAPSISPNKTWEGVLGGVIITCLLSVIYLFIVDATSINIVLCIIFIAILSAVSIFGDLVESMIKRFAKVKDSGNIIPGHGGFFDRLDALVVSLPLFWIATQYIPAIHMYFVSF